MNVSLTQRASLLWSLGVQPTLPIHLPPLNGSGLEGDSLVTLTFVRYRYRLS